MSLPSGAFALGPGESRRPGHVVLKASAADTKGAYALRETVAEPGFMVQPHRHATTDELWYVIEGTLTFLAGEEVVSAVTGGTVFVPRGVTHAFTNAGPGTARFLVIFSPAGLEEMFEELLTLRASGQSSQPLRDAISARYGTEDIEVAPTLWPPRR